VEILISGKKKEPNRPYELVCLEVSGIESAMVETKSPSLENDAPLDGELQITKTKRKIIFIPYAWFLVVCDRWSRGKET
jgi:hypothetical protein